MLLLYTVADVKTEKKGTETTRKTTTSSDILKGAHGQGKPGEVGKFCKITEKRKILSYLKFDRAPIKLAMRCPPATRFSNNDSVGRIYNNNIICQLAPPISFLKS